MVLKWTAPPTIHSVFTVFSEWWPALRAFIENEWDKYRWGMNIVVVGVRTGHCGQVNLKRVSVKQR